MFEKVTDKVVVNEIPIDYGGPGSSQFFDYQQFGDRVVYTSIRCDFMVIYNYVRHKLYVADAYGRVEECDGHRMPNICNGFCYAKVMFDQDRLLDMRMYADDTVVMSIEDRKDTRTVVKHMRLGWKSRFGLMYDMKRRTVAKAIVMCWMREECMMSCLPREVLELVMWWAV